MAANKKDAGVIYRCPACFDMLNDVVIDMYDDGKYHCVKCGYVATTEELLEDYAQFRKRYKLIGTRLTLDDQRKL